jgi:hypothetical protein
MREKMHSTYAYRNLQPSYPKLPSISLDSHALRTLIPGDDAHLLPLVLTKKLDAPDCVASRLSVLGDAEASSGGGSLPGDEGWQHGECWWLRWGRHGLDRWVKAPIKVAHEGGGRWLRELSSGVGRLRARGCGGRRRRSRSQPTTSAVVDTATVLNEAKEGWRRARWVRPTEAGQPAGR